MAITLITGVPGAGKTLSAIKIIAEQVKVNNDPKTAPEDIRTVYTDIDGINFPDHVIEVAADHDWRDTPDGSIIVYDEVHRRWPSTGKSGRSTDVTCNELDTHRHSGKDLVLITQYPTKLHFEARTNVSAHMHVSRINGAKVSTLFTWNSAQSNPEDYHAKQNADTEIFRFPKALFQHYKSATIHTHKFRIPAKLVFFAVLAFTPLSYAAYNVLSGNTFLTEGFNPASTAELTQKPQSGSAAAVSIPSSTSTALLGCISNDYSCHCYSNEGKVIEQSFIQCKATSNKPLAFPLAIASNRK